MRIRINPVVLGSLRGTARRVQNPFHHELYGTATRSTSGPRHNPCKDGRPKPRLASRRPQGCPPCPASLVAAPLSTDTPPETASTDTPRASNPAASMAEAPARRADDPTT